MKPRGQLVLLDVEPVVEWRLPPELEDDVSAVMGRCSGIPACCIGFFNEIRRAPLDEPAVKAHHESIPPGTEYVPCPRCLARGAFVKIRRCGPPGPCRCWLAGQALFSLPPSVRRNALALMERDFLRR